MSFEARLGVQIWLEDQLSGGDVVECDLEIRNKAKLQIDASVRLSLQLVLIAWLSAFCDPPLAVTVFDTCLDIIGNVERLGQIESRVC